MDVRDVESDELLLITCMTVTSVNLDMVMRPLGGRSVVTLTVTSGFDSQSVPRPAERKE